MRILHTADWHLGKKSDDLDRSEELKDVLGQIVNIAKEKQVDMVIIAGDIYDNYVPSSDAENLFYRTISELSNDGNTAVVVISGNHDDPKRLSNAGVFASKFNIYLVGDINNIAITKTSFRNKNIYPTECGKGYLKFRTRAGEDAVVACLPYPTYYRYNEIKRDGDNINDKIKEWLQPAVSMFSDSTINILAAHLLTYGKDLTTVESMEYGTISGTVSFVEEETLNVDADYVALGHIHTMVRLDKKKAEFYSGAIINTNFSPNNDTDKYVIIADLHKGQEPVIEPVKLNCKKMDVFESDSLEEIDKFCKVVKDDYVKAILTNSNGVDYETMKALRKRNPNLVTLSVLNSKYLDERIVESKKDLSNSELFDKFVKDMTGQEAKPEVKELFLQLMGEVLYETD